MKRGEIWFVDLDPARPGEANKMRPCVIVSNDTSNLVAQRIGAGVITVAPLTSNTTHVWPFQVLIPLGASDLELESKVQAEQVRAVAVGRFSRRVGSLTRDLQDQVDNALRLHLSLG